MRMVTALAGPLKLAQSPAQGLDLALIGIALPLEVFKQFQNLVHLLEALFECGDNLVHLVNGVFDAALWNRLATRVGCHRRRGRIADWARAFAWYRHLLPHLRFCRRTMRQHSRGRLCRNRSFLSRRARPVVPSAAAMAAA